MGIFFSQFLFPSFPKYFVFILWDKDIENFITLHVQKVKLHLIFLWFFPTIMWIINSISIGYCVCFFINQLSRSVFNLYSKRQVKLVFLPIIETWVWHLTLYIKPHDNGTFFWTLQICLQNRKQNDHQFCYFRGQVSRWNQCIKETKSRRAANTSFKVI